MKLFDGLLNKKNSTQNGFRVNFIFKENSDLLLVASYPHISHLIDENKTSLIIKTASSNDFEVLCFELELIEEIIIGQSLFLSLRIINKYIEKLNVIQNVFGITPSNERINGTISFDEKNNIYSFQTNEKVFTHSIRLIYNLIYSKKDINLDVLYFEDSLFNNKRSFYLSI